MARVRRAGRSFYRCFAVSHYATWEAAEAAARLWLRPVLAGLPAASGTVGLLTARNRSGVVGVFFRERPRVLRSGRFAAYPVYVARWPGAAAGVAWSVRGCGGEEGAFLRACLSRELRTADRCRVEWALRALSPERRSELLARRSGTQCGLRAAAPVADAA